jgi:glucose/arabinose dehydrogenase
MVKHITAFLLYAGLFLQLSAQVTPVQSLNLQTVSVEVPAQFQSELPLNYTVKLPPGFGARIFYAGGLNKPRFLSFDANGVLHMADQSGGKVFAFPDANKDGIADAAIEAATGFSNSHDVTFYNGNMYVTETTRVWKLTDANNDGVYEQRVVFIDNIGQGAAGGGHSTRTILFDSLHQKAYLSIGSSCNVCRETLRACIDEYNIDGTGRRTFATGVRNAVGLAQHPVTGKIWANNNGSDRQGTFIPPEWIDIVREDGFYGHPFAYGNKTWFNFNAHPDYQALLPITAADSDNVDRLVFPAALIEAHSAPMALTFLNGTFPPAMQHGIITALRGSWNTPNDYSGYKLMYLHLDNAQDSTADYAADFCTGFITDTVNRVFWARPVGLAINAQGSIFMSSDEGSRFIMEIYNTNPSGLNDVNSNPSFSLYPNPAGEKFYIDYRLRPESITLFDALGRAYAVSITDLGNRIAVDVSLLPEGLYYCVVSAGNATMHQKLLIGHAD